VRQKVGNGMKDLEKNPAHEGCRCGGAGRSGRTRTLAPHELLTVNFSATEIAHECACGGHACPRRYLAATGFILGAFLVLHLAVNALGRWPTLFQAAVNRVHGLGGMPPVLEIGLVLIPLAIHVTLGLRTLRRQKLKLDAYGHHHGSHVRYWLQRVTAVILLAFLAFHFATMHRWGLHLVYQITRWPALDRFAAAGLFEPSSAFASAQIGLANGWSTAPAHPANLLIAQLYLLAIAAGVYHLTNGMATGAEVLGFVQTREQNERLRSVCVAAGFVLALQQA
jgi:succinate dehydrogenase/fumarate reductase cytochrome b subunit